MTVHELNSGAGPSRCQNCGARRFGFCGRFDESSAAKFVEISHVASYRGGEELLGQGEPVERIGVLASGMVKVVMMTDEGDELVVQLVRPGELVGIPSHHSNHFSRVTATDSEICWVPRAAWERFLDERPRHFSAYLVGLLDQLEGIRLSVVKMRGRNTLQRVAFWILEEIPNSTGTDRPKVRILLSRRDLASLLDMTVETLSRSLHQLDDRKAIRLEKHDVIEVSDIVKLRLLAKWNDEAAHEALTGTEAHRDPGYRSHWVGRDETGGQARLAAGDGGGRRG